MEMSDTACDTPNTIRRIDSLEQEFCIEINDINRELELVENSSDTKKEQILRELNRCLSDASDKFKGLKEETCKARSKQIKNTYMKKIHKYKSDFGDAYLEFIKLEQRYTSEKNTDINQKATQVEPIPKTSQRGEKYGKLKEATQIEIKMAADNEILQENIRTVHISPIRKEKNCYKRHQQVWNLSFLSSIVIVSILVYNLTRH
jgi:DNA repair exonuclease SbcCD ATPase subunit